ncbi:MAG TPA: prephenate dehydratase [Candidatus Acetatifactor stercoripullorum]|uniref:Bifunctional chorismate mutase/prephenate dehydratase n=1 Tax=Candidatus Acetatifactor stercoripullorum TaxID=2838414 RepID=A0A9D1R6P0_9FIRM|nr:prephenate dehydratase [Candidatus Acetatifactor stercoripullorum]HIW81894.1 prephenate dehydratase [Candidatus Acetatifactor stercoripullorum]
MDLRKLREQIDGIDEQIVALYEKRMDISRQVAEYKIETGKKVFDRQREQEKLARVKTLTHNEFNSHGVEELFEQIMSMSRKLQYQLLAEKTGMGRLPFIGVDELDTKKARVVFQGAEGAYSQAAMMTYFGDAVDSFHVDSFRDAMSAIDEGSADFAVLPIENSTAGIVSEIYDLLVEFENYIVGEQIIKIEHCLLGVPGAELSDIKRVYSHPQSLMQSARYLADHDWQQISMQNNAFAAAKVAKEGDKTQAAIAGEHAGKIYGLKVLKKGINHSGSNSTRFIIVTNQKIFRKDAGKVSICFEVAHESGSLYHMLSHFIYNNLNLTKIESRPIEDRNWEYRFFVDFEGNLADSSVKNALRGLREEARNMKILGNY